MNGIPTQIIAGLAVSNRFPVEALEEIYEGMLLACNNYKVDLVGGDTTSSASGMMLSITAIGKVKKGNVVKRSGAKPKDLLVVSGDLGSAYMGLQVLEREKAAFKSNPNLQPELQGNEYVLERHKNGGLKPSIDAAEYPAYLQWFHYCEGMVMPPINTIMVHSVLLPPERRDQTALEQAQRL